MVMIPSNKADKYRKVVTEQVLIREKFPFLHSRISGLELICRGWIQPTEQSRSYRVEIRYSPWDSPVVRIIEPKIEFTPGAHMYHDFRQIESHGTTITIKVLFNLLLLKDQLRRDDCAVPFFLDEIQTLDPANRHAILRTARQLGFIAITAAPEPVSEVDAIYFLQPQKGRIVLRHKHRATVKRTSAANER